MSFTQQPDCLLFADGGLEKFIDPELREFRKMRNDVFDAPEPRSSTGKCETGGTMESVRSREMDMKIQQLIRSKLVLVLAFSTKVPIYCPKMYEQIEDKIVEKTGRPSCLSRYGAWLVLGYADSDEATWAMEKLDGESISNKTQVLVVGEDLEMPNMNSGASDVIPRVSEPTSSDNDYDVALMRKWVAKNHIVILDCRGGDGNTLPDLIREVRQHNGYNAHWRHGPEASPHIVVVYSAVGDATRAMAALNAISKDKGFKPILAHHRDAQPLGPRQVAQENNAERSQTTSDTNDNEQPKSQPEATWEEERKARRLALMI